MRETPRHQLVLSTCITGVKLTHCHRKQTTHQQILFSTLNYRGRIPSDILTRKKNPQQNLAKAAPIPRGKLPSNNHTKIKTK